MNISIVIPTYRRPALLSRCLDALYLQTFDKGKYEIIIVSDGLDLETKQVVEAFMKRGTLRLSYFALPTKRGPAAARNLGWQQACSNLIAFTDDDCIADADWLRNIYTNYLTIEIDEIAFTGKTMVPISSPPTDYELNVANLEKAEFITANCACTKKALEKTGGFDEQFSMAWREDSDLQFKLILNGIPIVPIEAKVVHPVRKAPWGISIKEERKGMFDALLYKNFPALYRQKIQARPPWLYYSILFFFIIFLTGLFVSVKWIAFIGLTGWIILLARFIYMRLSSTYRSFKHVAEMIVTSLIIPFLSIYWRWYGVIKYKAPLF
jgi:glycosyltransferase involved in cell wall biosynthesis